MISQKTRRPQKAEAKIFSANTRQAIVSATTQKSLKSHFCFYIIHFNSVLDYTSHMRLRHEERILKTIKRHKNAVCFRAFENCHNCSSFIHISLLLFRSRSGRKIQPNPSFSNIVFCGHHYSRNRGLPFDRLLITNKRTIWINSKSKFKKEEHEVEFIDIQDIETREKGLLSKLKIFNYGFFEIETASSKTCVTFQDCPDPDGVKHFILGEMERHHMSLKGKKENAEHPEEWSVN